jgi:hypothetical protein
MSRNHVGPALRLAAAIVLAGCLTAACDGPAGPPVPPAPLSSPTVAAVDGAVAFHVSLGAGQHLTVDPPSPEHCPAFGARVELGRGAFVRLTAYAADCQAEGSIGASNDSPGNGRHGVFRTTGDIPAARSVTAAPTPLGTAATFAQPYYECTNSCTYYTEPVAVITLTHPSDPGVPALTVYSERGTADLAALSRFLRDQLAQ